ncbi:colanic acid biosynthesis pyruvyl transferase WcaK [Vibrio olivae]|uniref:Colanic acid biosynthesis pyruvyl transferase WcaK n=1 Tax=Vibrio olivae TaxID=1243002 RepID=A0ABV5HLE3_9VIBR
MKKILIVGNHSCSNRGDAAILRGLIDFLESEFQEYDIDITSRYTDGAQFFFGHKVFKDTLSLARKQYTSIWGRIEKRLVNRIVLPKYLDKKITSPKLLPKAYKEFSEFIQPYDLVIQVGGSFFVDLYGVAQFEAAAVAIREEKPFLIIGHSVGPFKDPNVAKVANKVFKQANSLILRESVSEEHLDEVNVNSNHYVLGSDTAWLIDPTKYNPDIENLERRYIKDKPTVAITMRELAPFDVRLGVSQAQYEAKVAHLCQSLIESGYNVIALSTCTGFDNYHRDDRIPALRVGRMVNDSENYSVVMDELTDIELGTLLSKCVLTIGTRLHSAILSMRFGTPAFAVYYEHKSQGILNKIDMGDYSIDINSLDTESFKNRVLDKIANIESEREAMNQKLSVEIERCKSVIRSELAKVEVSSVELERPSPVVSNPVSEV